MLIARPRTGSPPAKPHNEPQCENASQVARISFIPHLIEFAAAEKPLSQRRTTFLPRRIMEGSASF